MTHLDNQIRNIQNEIQNNTDAGKRSGLPEPYTISHLEYLIQEYLASASAEERTLSGDAYAEADQLLRNLKILRNLEEENKHLTEIQPTPKFEYNYTSIHGTFTTLAETEQKAYSMFLDWLEQKDKEVVQPPEPEPEPLLSVNVRISFTDPSVGMFSSSIPINDITQLQSLSNASSDWKYTLIGSSTNQPLLALSGLINRIDSSIPVPPPPPPEPEPLTWYHVKKPSGLCEFLNVSQKFVNQMTSQGWIFSLNDICYEPPTPEPPTPEPPTPEPPTPEPPTPTEPGQVNWIPEPFFSFINNVFRK